MACEFFLTQTITKTLNIQCRSDAERTGDPTQCWHGDIAVVALQLDVASNDL